MSNHVEMIDALRGLYTCQPLRDAVTLEFGVGSEETNTPFLRASLRVAHGHDGQSMELTFNGVEVFNKAPRQLCADGDAVAVMDDDGALMLGCALVAFVLAKQESEQ
jgi:hypothetical protein